MGDAFSAIESLWKRVRRDADNPLRIEFAEDADDPGGSDDILVQLALFGSHGAPTVVIVVHRCRLLAPALAVVGAQHDQLAVAAAQCFEMQRRDIITSTWLRSLFVEEVYCTCKVRNFHKDR